ncbi:tetratricopeptide repeat protein [Streptomyces sp. MZ04]|uniref:tetratricopeptide repeat protein n=1 Tax=Streptomyces sp. MZ04 TaxID=2559236 RepID=UPI00107EB65B|nr:tetratricopeptide repeat protein [Streptomyces sp. MZ04]TGB15542.1 tetratricopeptide repeat protein [Streptomyces sp. MZ04]
MTETGTTVSPSDQRLLTGLPAATAARASPSHPAPPTITDEERGTTAVEAYGNLPEASAQICRLLAALPPAQWDIDTAVAVCGLSRQETVGQLETLCDAGLAQRQGQHPVRGDLYGFHDDVRRRARVHAEAEETNQSHIRALACWLDWMLATTSSAERLLMPWRRMLSRDLSGVPAPAPFTDEDGALAWLQTHQGDLELAVYAAEDRRWLPLVWQLVHAAGPLFQRLPPLELWRNLHERGLKAARACGHQEAERELLTTGASVLRGLRDVTEAARWASLAFDSAEATADQRSKAQALYELGLCHDADGRAEPAIALLSDAISVWEGPPISDQHGAALCRLALGSISLEAARAEPALDHLRRAVWELTGVGDRFNAARAQARRGLAHAQLGHHERAISLLSEALDSFIAMDSPPQQARVLAALGETTVRQGNWRDARDYFQQARIVFERFDALAADQIMRRLRTLESPLPNVLEGRG